MDLDVVVYTTDLSLVDMLRGLLGTEGSVSLAEEGSITLGQLVCIDYSYAHRSLVLDSLMDYGNSFVLAVLSANPFAISQLGSYSVDAFLSKPLNAEAAQALLLGVKARLAQKGQYG